MLRLFTFIVLCIGLSVAACSKKSEHSESILYGTWVKGPNIGDTMRFVRKNGTDILSYRNDLFANYYPGNTETPYVFRDNKLTLVTSSSIGPVEYEIDSFAWKKFGNQFQVTGTQFFPYTSSFFDFTYTKIN
jgi:hypothetical protein